jgi:hypothetical protein
MPESCKNCKFYGIDVDTVGRCLNHKSLEFGRLVWPSKKACEKGEDKNLTLFFDDPHNSEKRIS